MHNPIRVALVGYGLAGKVFHAPLIRATEGLALHCVVSSAPDKVNADIPGVSVVESLDAALADPSVDLVVLATPDHLHTPQALAALDAHKHVVIDKPFAPSLAEAERVSAHAARQNRMLTIFHNRRWDADFLAIKGLIAANTLGNIVQFDSHFDRLRRAGPTRWKDERDAGLWQDIGPHLVDQALHLFGMPEAVYADITTQRAGAPAPDYAHVVLRYPGLRAILHMSQSTHAGGLRFAVHGTHGSYIKYGLDVQEDQSKAGMTPDNPSWGIDSQSGVLTQIDAHGVSNEQPLVSPRGDYPAFYAQVRDALLGRRKNPVPADEALDVMRILHAGIVSAKERREIPV